MCVRRFETSGRVDIDGTHGEIVLEAIVLESIKTPRRNLIFENGIRTNHCPDQNALRRFCWRSLTYELDDALHLFIAVVYQDDLAAPTRAVGEIRNENDAGRHVRIIGYRNGAQKAVVSFVGEEA